MKFTSALIAAGSGHLGGLVVSHNRGGQYMRRRAIPTQPRTTAQRAVRNGFAAFSSAFRTISLTQVAGWNALGATVTLKSKLGLTYHLTGQQLFVSCNKHLGTIGIATQLSTAPTIPSIPGISVFTITQGGTPGSPATVTAINYTLSPALPSNFGVVVRATSVMSAGRTFAGKSQYRTLGYANPASGLANSLLTLYTNRFGPLPQAGIISFALKLVDPVTGFAGPPVTATYAYNQPVGSDLYSVANGAQTGATTAGSGTVTFSVTPTAIGGFSGALYYSASNLPALCTYTYAHNPYSVASPNTLSVIAASASPGTYTIDTIVTYGTFSVTTPATLTIV
jgi:hypothetical protein